MLHELPKVFKVTPVYGMWITECNNQSLKGAVVVTLCQNEADVKFQMEIDSHISLTEQGVGVNLHWKFYICFILAEGHNNCSF